jgi:hypothetical protein
MFSAPCFARICYFLPQKLKTVSNAVSDLILFSREKSVELKWCPRPELNRDLPLRRRQLYPFELRERVAGIQQ